MFTRLPYSSHIAPDTTAWDTATVTQKGPMIVEGHEKLKVLRQNLPVGSEPLEQTERGAK
jgi:hypothetical protein